MSNSEFGSISFDLPKNQSNVIKVIGVGGGGSNAVNHMFRQGIIKVNIGQRYKLEDAAKAHADLEGRRTTGSTVLLV